MTFATYEESQASGEPTQLFLFRYGDAEGEFYAYTDHTEALTVDHGVPIGEVTYEPIPVKRDGIVANGTMDRSALGLRMDIGTGLSELFRVYPPSAVVTLTLFHGHLNDPDGQFLVAWTGRVMSASRDTSELVLTGEPINTAMKRPGLRRNYQYGCPLVLYGQGPGQCNASEAAATVAGTVAGIAGTVVTLNAGWNGAFAAAKFVRGMLTWTPAGKSIQRRMIVRVAGDALSLSGLPTDLAVAGAVNVVLGCNHKAFAPDGDCEALHANLPNYGGQPFIPIKNVVNANPYY